MQTLKLSSDAEEILRQAHALAQDAAHQTVDTPHILLAFLNTTVGKNWAKSYESSGKANLEERLEKAMLSWCETGFKDAEPSQNYILVMRAATEIATKSASHQIEPVHLLNAALEKDFMLRDWLVSIGFQLLPTKVTPSTPVLNELGRDLTELARNGALLPVAGRVTEMAQVIEILMRQGKNSILLLGLPGVGKTAVVEKFAQMIASGDVPPKLVGTRLIEVSTSGLVAGTTYRGEFEERIRQILEEIVELKNVILVIDEFHTLIGAGTTRENALDAANILKPALARGELTCIGITTQEEYTRFIEHDQALVRRFQTVNIPEPLPEATREILLQLTPSYEAYHNVLVQSETLDSIIKLTSQYLPFRQFPDKAIDVLGRVCSRAEIQKLQTVTPDLVAAIVSETVGIPLGQLTKDIRQQLLNLENSLSTAIFGQTDAVRTVTRAVRIAYTGLRDPNRPKAIFLFSGPSGVGKTQLARKIAEYLFTSEDALIRVDMSEFADRHAISRLIGAPPGYIGHDKPGQLTQPLRDRPHSLVLLDEVEKAHPEVFDIFLQLFGEGRLTDAQGRSVDGRHAIFVMTTNLGVRHSVQRSTGFSINNVLSNDSIATIDEAVRAFFRPEFLNRIDHIVPFRSLDFDDLAAIAEMELQQLRNRLKDLQIRLSFTSNVAEVVAHAAQRDGAGARGIKRAVEEMIAIPISQKLIELTQPNHQWLHLEVDGHNILMEWV